MRDLVKLLENAKAWAHELNRQVHTEHKLRLRAENALAAIAEQGEHLEAMGEPQNNVPQFCRAILRGEDIKLGDI
jgi:hypothetical protein